MTEDKEYLDADTETAGDCKAMSEIVNHVSQQIQPATSLHTPDQNHRIIMNTNDCKYSKLLTTSIITV